MFRKITFLVGVALVVIFLASAGLVFATGNIPGEHFQPPYPLLPPNVWPFFDFDIDGAPDPLLLERLSPLVQSNLSPPLVSESVTATYWKGSDVSAGGWHTCALTDAGGVKCWGNNMDGELGDGTYTQSNDPVNVINLTSNVIQVSAGYQHTCVVTDSGGVKCWGANYYGQLGDDTTNGRNVPGDVVNLGDGVVQVSAGGTHTCAVTASGTVKCWGSNFAGELGNNDTNNSGVPVDVSGLNGVIQVSAGSSHTCALIDDGTVKCWGSNFYGQLGNNDTNNSSVPVDVSGLNGVIQVSAGEKHTCAVLDSGIVKCWGDNEYGQLGNSSINNSNIPVEVVGLIGVVQVSAGGFHTCAITNSGSVKCWGDNWAGQLGDGTYDKSNTPVNVNNLTEGVSVLSLGRNHGCALISNGNIKCWGSNSSGQLGDGSSAQYSSPVNVDNDVSSDIGDVSSGGKHSCVINASGGIECWGSNESGQLGDGTLYTHYTASIVSSLDSSVTHVSAGLSHTCAVTNSGAVKCWGDESLLGSDNISDNTLPVVVDGLSSGTAQVSAGQWHTCALTNLGAVKCWGTNYNGQLGDGSNDYSKTPVDVYGLDSGVDQISAGGSHTCALLSSGTVKCWGANYNGQLGNGTTDNKNTPVDVSNLNNVTQISAGDSHTCALLSSGAVKCWGANYNGQLGDNTTSPSNTPIDVFGLSNGIVLVSAGDSHTCAVTNAGTVKCWGDNGSGQIGQPPGWGPVDIVGVIHSIIIDIALAGNGDIELSWLHQAVNALYKVWRSDSPYFDPSASSTHLGDVSHPANEGDSVSYTDTTTSSSDNYYYQVQGLDSGNDVGSTSNEVGVFRFALISGN